MIIDAYIIIPSGQTLLETIKNTTNGHPEILETLAKAKDRTSEGLKGWEIHKVKIEEIILSPMQAAKEALGTNTPKF